MVQSSDRRGDTSRTLFKIILMLGLALAGVAAIAAEPPQTEAAQAEPASTTTCAQTKLSFGGRIIENGEVTDTWTLTCWREPVQQAAVAPPASPTAKPIDALPVATQTVRQTGAASGAGRF